MAAQFGLRRAAPCAVHGVAVGALWAAAQIAGAQSSAASKGPVLSLSKGSGQAYPVKTLRLIASQVPGGGIDTVARIISSRLSEALGRW